MTASLDQSSKDTDPQGNVLSDVFLNLQELADVEINHSFENPIEEYFTSKANHDNSFDFWSENMMKFDNGSLL